MKVNKNQILLVYKMKQLMKKTTIVFFVALLFGFSACGDDFVVTTPQGSLTDAAFWRTEADAIAASNALYWRWFDNNNMYGRGLMWYINVSDDMVTGRADAASARLRDFVADGSESRVRDYYGFAYQAIQYANNIIRNVPDMEIRESLKNRIIGEAYFTRGYFQFKLAGLYGDHRAGIPIVTEDNMEDDFFPRTSHVRENYAAAAADLNRASELLPYFTSYSGEDLGRAHKDAANAFLAKTYLYWGEYDDSQWSNAVEAANRVINSPTNRALINTGNPETDFHSVFWIENNWSSEYIFSIVSGTVSGSILPGVMLEQVGWGLYNGWGYFHPTIDLYNHFEEGDHRKKATILEFGDEFMFNGEPRRYFSSNSWTGFQYNKYMEGYWEDFSINVNPNGNKPTTNLNIPLIRFAEIILIKAEALLMQGLNADTEINMIRERAGLTPITNATMDDLKRERRSELSGEFSDRHKDLVRWGDAQEAYSRPDLGRAHFDSNDPDSGYEIIQAWSARSNFDPNVHHVWPIPTRYVEASGIEQNQGW